jgi:hypothetical protein
LPQLSQFLERLGEGRIGGRQCGRNHRLRNTRTLFSFFLLKLRYAPLQNGNSALEVIYFTARRVKFLLAVGRIFRNQFLEKVYVALQATRSSHHALFNRADFHTRNILCACGTGNERYGDSKNQRLQHHNPVGEITRRGRATRSGGDLAGAGSSRSAAVAASAPRSPISSGLLELRTQKLGNLAQPGDLGLGSGHCERHCVSLRCLDVASLPGRWIDTVELGVVDVPLPAFVPVAADFAGFDRPQ